MLTEGKTKMTLKIISPKRLSNVHSPPSGNGGVETSSNLYS